MKLTEYRLFNKPLASINSGKNLICTLNAHCYNLAKTDSVYENALLNSDVLLYDGISVVWATLWLTGQKLKKVAGADLFFYEMERMQKIAEEKGKRGRVFFLGSTEETLEKIKAQSAMEYNTVQVETYSPPYKPEFTNEDNVAMLRAINSFRPDVLFIGMTAPKQEKWAYQHYNELKVGHICCIGAVFDFYAGTVKRAPQWMINLGLEWFYRLIREPRRMWKRYLIGNTKFIYYILKEKIELSSCRNNK